MAAGGLLKKDKFCNKISALFRQLATMKHTAGSKRRLQVLKQDLEVLKMRWGDILGQICAGLPTCSHPARCAQVPEQSCRGRVLERVRVCVCILDDKIPGYASGIIVR